MRRLIPSIIAFTLTSGLGVAASLLSSHSPWPATSLCIVAGNPDLYDQKMVRVKASAWVLSSALTPGYISIYDMSCQSSDASAVIELDQFYKPTAEVNAFIHDPKQEVRKAEVVVVGRFDQWATMGCFTPRFGIRATEIKLISPVTNEPLPTREPHVAK